MHYPYRAQEASHSFDRVTINRDAAGFGRAGQLAAATHPTTALRSNSHLHGEAMIVPRQRKLITLTRIRISRSQPIDALGHLLARSTTQTASSLTLTDQRRTASTRRQTMT
jgi:hypothetical protein